MLEVYCEKLLCIRVWIRIHTHFIQVICCCSEILILGRFVSIYFLCVLNLHRIQMQTSWYMYRHCLINYGGEQESAGILGFQKCQRIPSYTSVQEEGIANSRIVLQPAVLPGLQLSCHLPADLLDTGYSLGRAGGSGIWIYTSCTCVYALICHRIQSKAIGIGMPFNLS